MIETLERSARGRAEWDAFIASHSDATCYDLDGWADVAERAYGIRPHPLVSRERFGGAIRGALPLFVVPRPGRRYVTTGLFGAYGAHGCTLGAAPACAELLEEARRVTERSGASYLHVKALGSSGHAGDAFAGFVRHDLWVRATLALDRDPESIWRRLRCAVRAQIRQARSCRLEARFDRAHLGDFYDVLAENMHKKGAPIYGLRFMRALVDAFGDRAEVATLWLGRRAIAGALTLRFQEVVAVPFASARPAYLRLRPNSLLYWLLIERAARAGARAFDFGSSLRDTTALAFKRHWGAVVEPIRSYVYARGGTQPVLAPTGSAAVQTAVRVWRRLPRPAADALGPWVCRALA